MGVAAAVPGSRLRGMYEMRPSNVFCPEGCTTCPSPDPTPKYGLCPGWESHVTAMAALLEPAWRSGVLSSISLPDEVGCSGRVSFEQIDLATTAIRDSVAGWGPNPHGQNRLFIHHNDCDVMGNPDMGPDYCKFPNDLSRTNCSTVHGNWPRVPEAIDYFSIDQYSSCHTYINEQLGNCSLYNDEEPARLKWYYESYVFPKLAPHQKTWVVPGLFGDSNCHAVNGSVDVLQPMCIGFAGSDAELMALQEQMLVRKLRGYTRWIREESRVTGMLSYTWDHHSNYINTSEAFMVLGANDFPKVMAELKTIAATIVPAPAAYYRRTTSLAAKSDDQQHLAADDDGATVAAPRAVSARVTPPAHVNIMTGCGYNASAQAGWNTFGKSFNLSALIEGYHQHGLPGVYKLDCVDCQILEKGNPAAGIRKQPGFAAGVICNARGCQTGPPSDPNCTKCPLVYHMCNKTSCGDKTNWDEQALHLLGLAQPHLISGALRGVWLGDELTAAGYGTHPNVASALTFRDLEKYINLVRGFLDGKCSRSLCVFFRSLTEVAAQSTSRPRAERPASRRS